MIVAGAEVGTVAARLPAGAARGTSREAIAGAVAFVVERYRPERVVLFGSRATGKARATSDIDLLVVLDLPAAEGVATERTARAEAMRGALAAAGFARMHPTVRMPAQIRLGLAEGDFFVEEMMGGVVLFAGDRAAGSGERRGDSEGEEGGLGLKRATAEWMAKAEADMRVAERIALPPPELDMVCFLSQQSAEKWLKALLQERVVRFGRTRDLVELAAAAAGVLPELGRRRDDLAWLTGFAVAVRCPGLSAMPGDAERALALAGEVGRLVRGALGVAGTGV